MTKKLARYLNWLQHDTKIFNVGERRRVAAGGVNSPVTSKVMRESVASVRKTLAAGDNTRNESERASASRAAAHMLINEVCVRPFHL